MSKGFWQGSVLIGAVALAAILAGCGNQSGMLIGNERPAVQLSARPMEQDSVFYAVRLQWFGSDSDGQVTGFLWAVDPPAEGDTAWQSIARSDTTLFFRSTDPDSASISVPFPPTGVTSRDYHVFVIKSRDDQGALSRPEFVAFTSETVAPSTSISDPPPSRLTIAITTPAVIIRWTGQDQDGVLTQRPIKYKYKLASQSLVQNVLGLGTTSPSPGDLQRFFSQEAPGFASWDSVPAESTFKQYEGLTPGQIWFFAVSAVDEAGAYEPRFNLDSNLLRFKPGTQLQAPGLTVFNAYFSRSQGTTGSFDLSENRVVRLEVPEADPVPFFWEARAVAGTVISGYRWALDIEDVFNETPREQDSQTDRWSSWSTSELGATVGPFYVEADTDYTTDPPTISIRDTHRLYIEARDNVGTISIMIIEVRAVPPLFKSIPPAEQRILIFDDTRANTDRTSNGLRPYGAFPTEAILDSLLCAVGGHPFKYDPFPLSKPGVFVGFPYDTLDYRFTASAGLPLSTLTQYNAVVWYTQALDAGLTDDKFSTTPSGALRFINKTGELNTLAVYLSAGGQAWLFGDGIAPAVANGYVTRFTSSAPAFFPYNGQLTGGARPSATSILWPGNFLYDYMKLYSQMDKVDFAGVGDPLSDLDELSGMTPYLPEYRTPGAPWPPEGPPPVTERGPADDPRVGPSSSRHVGRWTGLPLLSFTTEFPDWPTALPTSTRVVPFVSLPNVITEGSPPVSVLDTLYLYRAKAFRLKAARDWPDGKPVWFHYWGSAHGQINWTSAPIWLFERTQLQLVADRILAQFGFTRNTDPRTWTGPGSVRDRDDYVAAGR
jgi:hypothetical protein